MARSKLILYVHRDRDALLKLSFGKGGKELTRLIFRTSPHEHYQIKNIDCNITNS